jgi:hypothetical protein
MSDELRKAAADFEGHVKTGGGVSFEADPSELWWATTATFRGEIVPLTHVTNQLKYASDTVERYAQQAMRALKSGGLDWFDYPGVDVRFEKGRALTVMAALKFQPRLQDEQWDLALQIIKDHGLD